MRGRREGGRRRGDQGGVQGIGMTRKGQKRGVRERGHKIELREGDQKRGVRNGDQKRGVREGDLEEWGRGEDLRREARKRRGGRGGEEKGRRSVGGRAILRWILRGRQKLRGREGGQGRGTCLRMESEGSGRARGRIVLAGAEGPRQAPGDGLITPLQGHFYHVYITVKYFRLS